MNNIIERTWRQGELGQVDNLTGTAFSAEEKAHTFRIRREDPEGIALALSGTVSATFMRSDKTDVTVCLSDLKLQQLLAGRRAGAWRPPSS